MKPYYFEFDLTLNHTSVTYLDAPLENVPVFSAKHKQELCPYEIPSVKEIMKLIDSATYRINKSQFISDVFECGAIAISNKVDFTQNESREERYKQIMQKYRPDERELICDVFGKIFALLSSVVYDDGDFDDYLGGLFMLCNQGDKNAGQYFTPYHISRFMAGISIQENVRTLAEKNGIITICDPCSGGGGMLIAALDVLKNDYGISYARNCFMEATDIDIRCVHMTYLQLSLAGVPAIVKHMDSLSRKLWSVWKTPAFIFQYPRFAGYENPN